MEGPLSVFGPTERQADGPPSHRATPPMRRSASFMVATQWSDRSASRRGCSPVRWSGAHANLANGLREKVELMLAWQRVAKELADGVLGAEFGRAERDEVRSRLSAAKEVAAAEVQPVTASWRCTTANRRMVSRSSTWRRPLEHQRHSGRAGGRRPQAPRTEPAAAFLAHPPQQPSLLQCPLVGLPPYGVRERFREGRTSAICRYAVATSHFVSSACLSSLDSSVNLALL